MSANRRRYFPLGLTGSRCPRRRQSSSGVRLMASSEINVPWGWLPRCQAACWDSHHPQAIFAPRCREYYAGMRGFRLMANSRQL